MILPLDVKQLNGPGLFSARSTLGSDISLIFAVIFILSFILAGQLARGKKGVRHHRTILFSMALMITYLGYYYKIRQMGLSSAADQMHFKGPAWFYGAIFRPLLYLHITLVASTLYLSFYMLINGFIAKFPLDDGNMTLKTGIVKTSWTLWGIGIAWFAFLLWKLAPSQNLDITHKAIIFTLGFFLPAGVSLLIHKTLPKADQRHRTVGRITMILFSLMLVTTTVTYYLIYIARY
jgi:uncharacterized membrane protein YozB (DUF420 family)